MPPVILPALVFLGPLLILGGVIAVIVAQARHGGTASEPGIGTLRRVFLYTLSLAGLAAAGIGMVLLVRSVLDRMFGEAVVAVEDTTLALGLALTMVGTPVWLGFWWIAHRALREHPVESRSLARKVNIYIVLGGSALIAAIGAISFLQWALGTGSFSGTSPAVLLVWGCLWAYHWRLEDHEDQLTDVTATVRRLYVYVLALLGLAMLATGVGEALRFALEGTYRSLFGAPLLVAGEYVIWSDATRSSLATATIGGILWWWHWHRAARGDAEARLRSVYLYLFAILSGAATVVTSCSIALYHVLQWLFGRPETSSARDHFDVLPGLLAAVVVGSGVWAYHWAVTKQEAGEATRGVAAARRVYSYIVSALGLVTLGVGLVILFAVFFGLIAPATGPSLRDDLWRNPLMLSVTLQVVGVPLWWLFSRSLERMVLQGEAEERGALSRRLFIYGTFGVSVVLTLINLSIVLFNAFDTLLGTRTASTLLWDSRWGLAILLTAGAVSGYYWLVLQEDRRALMAAPVAPGLARPRRQVTVVGSEADLPLVRRLEARLGYPVTVWRRIDDRREAVAISDEELAHVERRIAEAGSGQVLLLVGIDGIRVIPYVH